MTKLEELEAACDAAWAACAAAYQAADTASAAYQAELKKTKD